MNWFFKNLKFNPDSGGAGTPATPAPATPSATPDPSVAPAPPAASPERFAQPGAMQAQFVTPNNGQPQNDGPVQLLNYDNVRPAQQPPVAPEGTAPVADPPAGTGEDVEPPVEQLDNVTDPASLDAGEPEPHVDEPEDAYTYASRLIATRNPTLVAQGMVILNTLQANDQPQQQAPPQEQVDPKKAYRDWEQHTRAGLISKIQKENSTYERDENGELVVDERRNPIMTKPDVENDPRLRADLENRMEMARLKKQNQELIEWRRTQDAQQQGQRLEQEGRQMAQDHILRKFPAIGEMTGSEREKIIHSYFKAVKMVVNTDPSVAFDDQIFGEPTPEQILDRALDFVAALNPLRTQNKGGMPQTPKSPQLGSTQNGTKQGIARSPQEAPTAPNIGPAGSPHLQPPAPNSQRNRLDGLSLRERAALTPTQYDQLVGNNSE